MPDPISCLNAALEGRYAIDPPNAGHLLEPGWCCNSAKDMGGYATAIAAPPDGVRSRPAFIGPSSGVEPMEAAIVIEGKHSMPWAELWRQVSNRRS